MKERFLNLLDRISPASALRCWPSCRIWPNALYDAGLRLIALLLFFTGLISCSQKNPENEERPVAEEGAVFRVGSTVVRQTDIDFELKEKHAGLRDEATMKKAVDDLVTRAQFTEAALAANVNHDPIVRAQIARILASRLKEQLLNPRLKEMSAPIPEPRLRELYEAEADRFRSNEKRQAAVLWLNPSDNPERKKQYVEKLEAARAWFLNNRDLQDHPDQGFSVLSVDHSEHSASRYNGGIAGWLEREGGMDAWSKAVAEIAFSLKEPGEVSPVLARPEGVFLVRYMALKPAVLRPFEAVADALDRRERQQMRTAAEAQFNADIKEKHPVQWLTK